MNQSITNAGTDFEQVSEILIAWLESEIILGDPMNLLEQTNVSFIDGWLKECLAKIKTKTPFDFQLSPSEELSLIENLSHGYAGLPLKLRKQLVQVFSEVTQKVREARTSQAIKEIRNHAFRVQASQRFRSGIVLPNEDGLWAWGMSLGVYTDIRGITIYGQTLHDYKYENISTEERTRIEEFLTSVTRQFIQFRLAESFVEDPPFDVCLGVPPNNSKGISICREIGRGLVQGYPTWLRDGFSLVRRTRAIGPVKRKSKTEKQALLSGLYSIDVTTSLKPKRGILILDDVFQTGSSVKELCKTLEAVWPNIPRFVITITHLKDTEMTLR